MQPNSVVRTGQSSVLGRLLVAQPFRTAYLNFGADSGPSRDDPIDAASAQLCPARLRVGKLSRTKSVLGIDLADGVH